MGLFHRPLVGTWCHSISVFSPDKSVFADMFMPGQTCGGLSDTQPADDKIQGHVNAVKGSVEAHLGKKFEVFEAKSYASQVVAGANYFVKGHVGNDEFIHLRIHKTLPHAGNQILFHGVQEGKKLEDPIEHLEQNAGD